MPAPITYSTTGSVLSSDEIAFAQRVAASFSLSMGAGWIKTIRQVDPNTNAVVEYHVDKNIAYVTPGGGLIIGKFFGATTPADGNYYTTTDDIKYDSTTSALTLKNKGYPQITTNSFLTGWPGLPNQRESSWLVLSAVLSTDSLTNHKILSITYVALKATGKTKTVAYDIDALLPGADEVQLIDTAPLGDDTVAVLQINDSALLTQKYMACSREDGTLCEVTGVLSTHTAATQNAFWVVDGDMFQRVNKIDGELAVTTLTAPQVAYTTSIGLTSIGGHSGVYQTLTLQRIAEDLSITTKSYTSADVAALTGVAGNYYPQPLSVSCVDSDVISCSYWQLDTWPYPTVGIRATLAELSVLTPLAAGGDLGSGMIDGGVLGDGLFGVCYDDSAGGYVASYAYTVKAFDAAGALQDTTEVVNTDDTPSTVGVVGTSSRAVYVWDVGDYQHNYKLRKFDRTTKRWGLVTPPTGAWSPYMPFIYSTPDVDFVFQRATSPTRTVITSTADPTFTTALTGLWDSPGRVYYDAKTRTLVIANQLAVTNVGREDMEFVPASAFVFKPPSTSDGSFISKYQRPASNTQATVFSFPQAESWGQLWDEQMVAIQPA